MVLRVRVRTGRILIDSPSNSQMNAYVLIIGGGKKFRTQTDSKGGKQPIWEQLISFYNCPPNIKVEVWVERNNGDILIAELLVDLCNFYQREPYRIEPKLLKMGLNKQATVEIKIEMDFDFEGMSQDHIKRLKAEQKKVNPKPEYKGDNTGDHHKGDLLPGTVIAQGKKAQLKEPNHVHGMHHQKPHTANNPNGYHKPHSPQQAQKYDYGNGNKNQGWDVPKKHNLLDIFGFQGQQGQGKEQPMGNKRPHNDNGWSL